MPGLARKVLIYAAVDGLVLQPLSTKKEQRVDIPVKIRYGDNAILSAPRDPSVDSDKQGASFEAFGVIGLINLPKFSYLVSITRRQQVATIRGSAIYVATQVALTPCASYDEADEAVQRTAHELKQRPMGSSSDDDSDNDNDNDQTEDRGDAEPAMWPADDIGDERSLKDKDSSSIKERNGTAAKSPVNSIAEDVISRRGSYGRFAQRWFSRSGWMQEQKRLMGLTGEAKAIEADEEAVGDSATNTEQTALDGQSIESTLSKQTVSEDPLTSCTSPTDVASDVAVIAAAAASAVAAVDKVAEPCTVSPPEDPTEDPPAKDSAVATLLPKFLRTTQMLFGVSRAFYFSYDYDITRSLAKQPRMRWNEVPLHKLVDPLYFWNRHILQPFIDAGADVLALPLMQGFVGQRAFAVDSHPPQTDEGSKDSVELSDFRYQAGSPPPPLSSSQTLSARTSSEAEWRPSERQFDITLISRRSVKRAGLRYLRRGVDEDGNVANAVETEQILSPTTADYLAQETPPQEEQPTADFKTYSFVQMRGSIPLFFTQSPYSLKPVPILQHSPEANFAALKKHFDGLRQQYGSLQIVNLVEKHGLEAPLGTQYEENVRKLNEEEDSISRSTDHEIPFEWFDFHRACKGMKFENVSLLLNTLSKELEQFGSTVEETTWTDSAGATGHSGSVGTIAQQQKGVLRTNCMDCLDRTNVCQSSFAKFMLDAQLKEQGYDMLLQRDQENAWFNTLWADNGDAISKQYASTAAMKGDYTRTRKRDYRGALTDAGLSLTRFFNGIVNDFFLQTTIDFLLGNVTDQIFDEFEANMETKDPAMSMQKMREQAIDLCQRRVVADESEEFVGGWTLLAPHDADASLVAPPFEEVVLLLTDAALYLCRVDWNLDKLSSFERVDLTHVEEIKVGAYILSTVTPMQMDETRNVGFVVSYRPGRNDILRINTRSLSSMMLGEGEGEDGAESKSPATASPTTDVSEILASGFANLLRLRLPTSPPSKRIAFKALYTDTSLATSTAVAANEHGNKLTEMQQIAAITAEIERLVVLSQPVVAGTERPALIVRGDIISLAEARKSTGLLVHLGHSLKKLVWA